jgi:hypothetical protein
MSVHPSIQRAREILAQGPEREREHDEWRSWHNPEDLIPTTSPRVNRKGYNGERVVYKTNWEARVAPAPEPPVEPANSERPLGIAEVLGDVADDVREEIALARDALRAEIDAIREQNAALRAKLELLTELVKTK